MKFACLFLTLLMLSGSAFANSRKYDVDFDYALEHYKGKEFQRYLRYWRKSTKEAREHYTLRIQARPDGVCYPYLSNPHPYLGPTVNVNIYN